MNFFLIRFIEDGYLSLITLKVDKVCHARSEDTRIFITFDIGAVGTECVGYLSSQSRDAVRA